MKDRKAWTLLLGSSAVILLTAFLLHGRGVLAAVPVLATAAEAAIPPDQSSPEQLTAILAAGGRGTAANGPRSDYMFVSDVWEFASMEVPATWKDVDTGPWVEEGVDMGIFISAAPDLAAFEAGTGPGVFFGLTKDGIPAAPVSEDPEAAVEQWARRRVEQHGQRLNACTRQGSQPYRDLYVQGVFDVGDCPRDRGRAQTALLEVMPLSQNYRASLRFVTFGPDDRAAVDHILRTFQVLNPSMIAPHEED